MVQPRPALGYIMVAVAATLFAVNGTVSKVILGSLRAQLGDVPLLVALGRRHPSDLARGSENPWRRSSCPVPYLPSSALGSPRPHGEKAALSEFDLPLLGEATPETPLCRLPRC